MKKILVIILFCITTTVSCSTYYDIGDQCINSFQDYSTAPLREHYINPVLPLAPWVIEDNIPENDILAPYRTVLVRSLNGKSEVWVNAKLSCDDCNYDRDAEYHYFLIYEPETKEWSTIPARIDDSIVYAYDLFLDSDGNIWARNTWDEYLPYGVDIHHEDSNEFNYHEIPFLSKYNNSTRRFEFVETPQQIPIIGKEDSFGSNITLNEILVDKDGIFWIFVHQDGIYKYDPIANQVSRITGIPDITVNIKSIAPNGDIYFGYFSMSMNLDVDLYRFNPKSGTVSYVELPEGKWPHISNMLFDNKGQLWLDLIIMRDVNNNWQKIYPHPWRYFLGLRWDFLKWAELPQIITESSNGIIWFRHGSKGMAWYDPNQKDGCWFTTIPTNIIEDDHQNIWLTAGSKLYKLSTKSQ